MHDGSCGIHTISKAFGGKGLPVVRYILVAYIFEENVSEASKGRSRQECQNGRQNQAIKALPFLKLESYTCQKEMLYSLPN